MERLSHNHAEDTSELLSAYVDNALDVSERRRAEAQAERCPGCAQELRDLRMFKALLHELPRVQPPRSFTLDPATAVGPRRLLFPTLRLATLVASVLFFVVLGADLLNIGGASSQATTTAFSTKEAPAAAQRQLQFDDTAGGEPESAESGAGGATASAAAAPESSTAAAASAPVAALTAPQPSAAAETAAGAGAPSQDMAAPTEPLNETAVAAIQIAPPTGDAAAQPPSAAAPSEQPQPASADQAAANEAQPSLQANDPSSPDTAPLQQVERYDQDSAARTTLRIVEIGLGLIALALAAGALWTWRRQR